MNQNGIALMERIDRSFVEHIRLAATSEKRGVGALVDAYRYLKTVTLKKREIRALERFLDPLEAVVECWRRKSDRFSFDFCVMLAEIETEAAYPSVIVVCGILFPCAEASRKQRERMMSARIILYGGI
jgi:hypothetical protein